MKKTRPVLTMTWHNLLGHRPASTRSEAWAWRHRCTPARRPCEAPGSSATLSALWVILPVETRQTCDPRLSSENPASKFNARPSPYTGSCNLPSRRRYLGVQTWSSLYEPLGGHIIAGRERSSSARHRIMQASSRR